MPDNQGLSHLSDHFLIVAVVLYSLAVVAFAADFAFGRRSTVAAQAETGVPDLVPAGVAAGAGTAESGVSASGATQSGTTANGATQSGATQSGAIQNGRPRTGPRRTPRHAKRAARTSPGPIGAARGRAAPWLVTPAREDSPRPR